MAQRPNVLQGADSSPIDLRTGAFRSVFYVFLKSLADAVNADITARQMVTASGAPAASDIPEGESRVWKDTGAGTVRLYVNDGGTLKSVLLT